MNFYIDVVFAFFSLSFGIFPTSCTPIIANVVLHFCLGLTDAVCCCYTTILYKHDVGPQRGQYNPTRLHAIESVRADATASKQQR